MRAKGLIEGRRPNFYIAQRVAQVTGQKAEYSRNKAFDKKYYLDLILKAIAEHGHLNRRDIDDLLWTKLPDWMNDDQRKNKVTNLIAELRRGHLIYNKGTDAGPRWERIS